MPALTPVVARRVTDPRDRPSEIEFRADDPRDAASGAVAGVDVGYRFVRRSDSPDGG